MKANFLLIILVCVIGNAASQTIQSNIPTANDEVNSIVRYNNTIYVGGVFNSVGTTGRNYLAAIDANTGAVLSWNPAPDGAIDKLLIAGNKLVVTGSYTTMSGSPRNGICVFDLTSGNLLGSNLEIGLMSVLEPLHYSGNYVYYCANDSMQQTAIRRFDINTLQRDVTWKSDNFSFNDINGLTVYGNFIYAAGWLDIFNGSIDINKLCRFNVSNGSLDTSFYFTFKNSDYLYSVVAHNGKIYVSGNFDLIDGFTRKGIAEIDTAGFVTTKNIYCSNKIIKALTLQGNTLWVGGNSVMLGGLNRYSIAQIDISTGIATCWFTQSLSGNLYMNTIWVSNDTVYAAPQSSGFKVFTGNPGNASIGNDTVLCAGSTLTLNAPTGLTGYLWNTGATTSSITVNLPGTYWFSATDIGGCAISGTRIIYACTGIENAVSQIYALMRPTISNGIFTLNIQPQKCEGKILIYDSRGNLADVFSVLPQQSEKQIDITSLASGVYSCRIVWENKLSSALKFIKL